jgi:hypothetical protein
MAPCFVRSVLRGFGEPSSSHLAGKVKNGGPSEIHSDYTHPDWSMCLTSVLVFCLVIYKIKYLAYFPKVGLCNLRLVCVLVIQFLQFCMSGCCYETVQITVHKDM